MRVVEGERNALVPLSWILETGQNSKEYIIMVLKQHLKHCEASLDVLSLRANNCRMGGWEAKCNSLVLAESEANCVTFYWEYKPSLKIIGYLLSNFVRIQESLFCQETS